MKFLKTLRASILGIIILFIFTLGGLATDIPPEPGMDKKKEIWIKQDSLIIAYDLDGDGKADYMTQREISLDYTMVSLYPLYYVVDMNRDFRVDDNEIWIDENRDGANGNEILYSEWRAKQTEEG